MANKAYNNGKLDVAENNYKKAIELNPNDVNAYYSLACLNSLREKPDEAFGYLKRAVEMNAENKSMAKADSDFDAIRDDDRFWEIVGRDE